MSDAGDLFAQAFMLRPDAGRPWRTPPHRLAPAPPRVCIDGRMLGVVGGTGVATYTHVLSQCLARAGVQAECLFDRTGGAGRSLAAAARGQRTPRMSRWIAALRRAPRVATPVSGDTVPVPDGRTGKAGEMAGWHAPDLFQEAQVHFNLYGRTLSVVCAAPPDIMHWTYPVPLHMEGACNLYTVHDLIPLRQPELTSISRRRHGRLLRAILQRADHLVTVSEHSRGDLIEMLGCRDDFVTNTGQAVHTPLQRDPALPAGLSAGGYFLYCGSVEPRKNLIRLIDAYRAARRQNGVARPLVIAGPDGWRAGEIRSAIGRDTAVVQLPWVERPLLVGLIRRARALLFPSLAEGFGLPVAEAMTLGTPVMTAGRGALAEVAGRAALAVDPLDAAALREAIAALDRDDELCRRLRAAGFGEARRFSMQVYGERLAGLYRQVMERAA